MIQLVPRPIRRGFLYTPAGLLLLVLAVCRHAPATHPGGPTGGESQESRGERQDRAPEEPEPVKIETLRAGGSRLDWCADDNLIAFDALGPDQQFDVHVMKPDGTGERCVTCDIEGLPTRHVGQAAWHPSCDYLVVQAEKQEHARVRFKRVTTPGAGVLNDLYLVNLETKQAHLLREVDDDRGRGVLHAHFSEDGEMLSWSEMVEKGGLKKGKELGYWKLMVADFEMKKGRPELSNIRSFSPGGDGFFENHGFSPDGSKLIYTSNVDTERRFENNIYVLHLSSGKTTQLTDNGYNEHALFSPDGERIIWISNAGNENRGTDYWIMNADGTGKRRLTFFNEEGHPHYAGKRVTVADFAWSPSGDAIAGYYRSGAGIETTSDPTQIVKIDLTERR